MKNIFFKEGNYFIALLVATLIVLYFTSGYVKLLFFIIVLIKFYYSKHNYFWLAYFSVVVFETGGFFVRDFILGFGAMPFSLVVLVSITTILKAFKIRGRTIFLFRGAYMLWLFYFIFLLFVGVLFFGLGQEGKSGLRHYFMLISVILSIPLLFYIPSYFTNYKVLIGYSKLIFIAVIINFLGQIIHLILGNPVFLIFNPQLDLFGSGLIDNDFGSSLIRPVWGHWIVFIGLFLALFFQTKKKYEFGSSFLNLIIFISYLSIFIGATRGWFLSFTFILILYPFIVGSKKNIIAISKMLIISLSLFIVSYNFIGSFKTHTDLVIVRLTTLKLMVDGDVTAGGTNSRLTTRSDKVLDLFRESPIIGNGISSKSMSTTDSHVGNQNMLMEGGIIGFLININLFVFVIFLSIKMHSLRKKHINYFNELLVIVIVFLGLFIIHSSSSAVFGYLIQITNPSKYFFISLIFGITNCILIENRKEIIY